MDKGVFEEPIYLPEYVPSTVDGVAPQIRGTHAVPGRVPLEFQELGQVVEDGGRHEGREEVLPGDNCIK